MAERGGPVARAVLQQCLQARLQVKPAEEEAEAQFVQVRASHDASPVMFSVKCTGMNQMRSIKAKSQVLNDHKAGKLYIC